MNDQVKAINDQFAKQAEEMMKAMKDVKLPGNMAATTEENITKTREVYEKVTVVAKDTGKAIEGISDTAQKGAKKISDKIMTNLEDNTEAVFKAAAAVAKAKSLPEAAKLHTDFFQQQFAIANAQTKELFEMTSKLAKKNAEAWNSTAANTMDQLKKSA